MSEPTALMLTEAERLLLKKHLKFYQSLDCGTLKPTTPAQEQFAAVCQGKVERSTDHEIAYLKFKKLLAIRKKQNTNNTLTDTKTDTKTDTAGHESRDDAAKRSAAAYENYGKHATPWKPHIYKDDKNGNRRWS